MLKVIVADDEEKICQLIVKLIDWQSADMEIAAIASNGFETMEAIEKYHPEVVITDIRMPGMDGLELIKKTKEAGIEAEFIIISGYRHFEYAQNAIRYGVSDYLLKPIKKDELNATLHKIRDRYREKHEQFTYEEKVKLLLKNDAGRLRTAYFSSVLYEQKREVKKLGIEEINSRYHYRFEDGWFQICCVKFDGISTNSENLRFIADKTASLIEQLFKECCYEYEIYVEGSFIYTLLNYSKEEQRHIIRQLKAFLSEFLVLESILEGLKVTIGAGKEVPHPSLLQDSLKQARNCIQQRLLEGTDQLIYDFEQKETGLADSRLFLDFNRDMTKALESMDVEQMKATLVHLQEDLRNRSGVTGHEILQMTKEVCNLFLFSMKNQKIVIDNEAHFLEDYNRKAGDCYRIDQLFSLLERELTDAYEKAIQNRKQEYDRPIRTARRYMNEHYMEPITLEDVSAVAGFSSTYFSSLFKKETGTAFLEYLSSIRMEEAKRLLRETNHNIDNICRSVGYSDVKYFTKSFIKTTGLKPTEYRKIYS